MRTEAVFILYTLYFVHYILYFIRTKAVWLEHASAGKDKPLNAEALKLAEKYRHPTRDISKVLSPQLIVQITNW